ncbi:MAG: hypothetical protein ACYC7G_01805 [Rudaea sp.]
MSRRITVTIFCAIAIAAALGMTLNLASRAQRRTPPQPTQGVESREDMQRLLAWMESLHNHAPGTDWRAMDAATRARLAKLRVQQSALLAQGARPLELINANAPVAVWREQGSNNWAGRSSAVDYDPATDRLTVFAHGGQLWRATRSNLSWQSLNDGRYFRASGNAQNFVRLNGAGATPERFVVADDSAKGIFYSDDEGKTWIASTGLNFLNWNGTTYMVARDPNGTELYATIIDYNGNVLQVHLVESNDRGATWNDFGFINSPQKVALFAMGQGPSLVYLLNGNQLSQVNTGTTLSLTPPILIPGVPTQTASDSVGLAGGIANSTPFFYAFFETNGTSTTPIISLNGGVTWTQATANIPAVSYIRVAAGTSLSNPNIACYGSVDLYCTTNGGNTFNIINDWSTYYANVPTQLHADISFVKSYLIGGNEVFFIGTDGGIYESTNGMQSVSNDNLTGLRDSQYYASYTGRNPPYALSIGAQDQGYQNNPAPATGATAYSQLISGDYADLTSSNGGATLWLNYAGTTVIDPAPASHPLYTTANTTTFPQWDFKSNGLDTNAMLFFPPLLAMPGNPNSALLSTAINPGTGDTFQVTQLTWDGVNTITASNGTFNFQSSVTAIASDGTNFYATANLSPGGAAFYSTTTPTGTWTAGATSLPQGQYLTGLSIVPDPVRASTIYVGGSGYSNAGVYVSTDGGAVFTTMSTGLPNTLVYALAISPDGNKLFAATEVGPYFYDLSSGPGNGTWAYIGTGAPTNIFWNVEFVPALNVARFSTYGRGIWDYDMGGGDLIFRNGFE